MVYSILLGPRAVSQPCLGEAGINVLKGDAKGTKGAAKEFLVPRKYADKAFCAWNFLRAFEGPSQAFIYRNEE